MSLEPRQNPDQILLVMRIITVSLLMGPLVFLLFVFVMKEDQPPRDPQQTYIAAGFAAAMIFAHFFVRLRPNRTSVPETLRNAKFDPFSDEVFRALAPVYQTELIIKLALLEGAAFYNIIAYQLEQHWLSLAVVALLLGLMASKFPSKRKIQQKIETQTMYWFQE